jgi:hypothetical protein
LTGTQPVNASQFEESDCGRSRRKADGATEHDIQASIFPVTVQLSDL